MADYSIWVFGVLVRQPSTTKKRRSLRRAQSGLRQAPPIAIALDQGPRITSRWSMWATTTRNTARRSATSRKSENWPFPEKKSWPGVGLTPEDVRHRVHQPTHIFDHFGQCRGLPEKRTFYIQEREITKWVWAMSLPDRLRWMMVRPSDPGDIIRGRFDLARQKAVSSAIDGTARECSSRTSTCNVAPFYDSHTYGSMWVHVRKRWKGAIERTPGRSPGRSRLRVTRISRVPGAGR